MDEIWKDIEGLEGYYQVSNYGRIRSLDRVVETSLNDRFYKGKILKPTINNTSGYYFVNLTKNGIEWSERRVHRLVAKTFLPNPENLPVVHHKNTNRQDNRVENLMWATYEDNSNCELSKQNMSESHREQTNENLMKIVYQYDLNGDFIAEYNSSKEASEAVGCCRSAITKGCREGIKIKDSYWSYIKKRVDDKSTPSYFT